MHVHPKIVTLTHMHGTVGAAGWLVAGIFFFHERVSKIPGIWFARSLLCYSYLCTPLYAQFMLSSMIIMMYMRGQL